MDKELHTNFVIGISDGDVPQDGPERTESICRLLCDIDEAGSDPEPCVFVVSLWNWWMLAESERRAGIDVPFDAFAGSLPPLLVSPVLSPDGKKYTHVREYWAQQQRARALTCRGVPMFNIIYQNGRCRGSRHGKSLAFTLLVVKHDL